MLRLYVALVVAAEAGILALLAIFAPGSVGPAFLLAGALIPLTIFLAIRARGTWWTSLRMRSISPEEITEYEPTEPQIATPEGLAGSIVERTAEIRRTLQENPSEVQIEMCVLGYRTCVNDMITLTRLVDEELPGASFMRRLTLRRARKRAAGALSATRDALPPGVLRATRQEQQ
jgi:hypothetical protein